MRPHTGVETLLDLQRTHGNAFSQRQVQCNWMTNEGRKGTADLKYAEGVQRNWFCSNLRNLGSSFRGGWELSRRPQLYSVSGALSIEEFGAKAPNP